jgi:hypothetical protein
MFGKNPCLNPLELRKQLLIAESELNRAQLVGEWQVIAGEIRSLARQAGTISSLASAAASLIAGLASFRRTRSTPANGKPSWLQTILKGTGLISTLWEAFRPAGRDRA